MSIITETIGGLVKPIAGIFAKREERKTQREMLSARIKEAKVNGETDIVLNEQQIETVRTAGLQDSWKDEYITLSIMMIVNMIVIGAVAHAFGLPELLQGMGLATQTLKETGVDVGYIINITITAGLGLSVWRKI